MWYDINKMEIQMKRYWMFAGEFYYPYGGMLDFKGSYDTEEEALANAYYRADWWHIFDTENKQVVKSSRPWWGLSVFL